MVMSSDIALFVKGLTTFLGCSRRGSPGGATRDLASTVDSSTQIVGENTAKVPEHQDLSGASTDGSNTGDVSDTESTAESAELEASSNSKHDTLKMQPPMMPPRLEGIGLDNKSGESVKQSCLSKWAQPFVPGAAGYGNQRNDLCMLSNLPAPLGFRPPPGLCQEPATEIKQLRQPLQAGSISPQAQIGAPKAKDIPQLEEYKLRSNLNKLAQFNPTCIFLVRKINKLGLNSAEILKTYFTKFGIVECVLASHSIENPSPGRRKPRVRPAGLAFVVMDKPEEVAKILRFGSEHVVQDVRIVAYPYEQHERWNPGCP